LFINGLQNQSGKLLKVDFINTLRMPYTMFVSAFWHGVHPGYFMSFLTIPLCTAAEDVVFKVFPADKEGKRNFVVDKM
jgi:hypothetical protein